MGRRHLILFAAFVGAAALAVPAGAAITWSELQRGTATGGSVKAPLGFVAYTRSDGSRFASHVAGAKGRIVDVDFKHQAVLAVVGQFGCQDPRIAVKTIVQRGSTLAVTLAKFPLKKGEVECQAVFPTFRLLLIGRSELKRPLPKRVAVTVAPA